VTCRRWNWRQARRTQLREDTTTALFILDALAPMSDKQLELAGADLLTHLHQIGPGLTVTQRLLSATPSLTSPTRQSPDEQGV
jgi:DNA/RNA-binding domain of Phe-tRNA-synthetase-like protein